MLALYCVNKRKKWVLPAQSKIQCPLKKIPSKGVPLEGIFLYSPHQTYTQLLGQLGYKVLVKLTKFSCLCALDCLKETFNIFRSMDLPIIIPAGPSSD